MNDFNQKLAQAIRDAGQELIDQADDISGTNPMLSSLTITIYFDPEWNMLNPTIDVDKEYLCRRAVDRLRGENDEST